MGGILLVHTTSFFSSNCNASVSSVGQNLRNTHSKPQYSMVYFSKLCRWCMIIDRRRLTSWAQCWSQVETSGASLQQHTQCSHKAGETHDTWLEEREENRSIHRRETHIAFLYPHTLSLTHIHRNMSFSVSSMASPR